LIGAACWSGALLRAAEKPVEWHAGHAQDAIAWPQFLARHDLVWERVPAAWPEGAFLGNGLLGAMIYRDAQSPLLWEIGRSDVVDHRAGDNNPLVNKARLPIGSLVLHPVGAVKSGSMRLDLWNAEATGRLVTDKGTIEWRSLVHAEDPVIVVELNASEGEAACRWEWRPAISATPRPKGKGLPAGYQANPPPGIEPRDGGGICTQALLAGGQYATAWKEVRPASGGLRRIYLSVGNSWPEATAREEALGQVERAAQRDWPALVETHRQWWHAFYPQSFLSIPDTHLESFYWIQMYKLASATRADRPAMDLLGPWYHQTIWPGIWWNLNIELAYSPAPAANRLELSESLCRLLENHVANLVANVKNFHAYTFKDEAAIVARVTSYDLAGGMFKGQAGSPEIGNLTWACHNYWQQCRWAADDVRLREKMLPLLRRAINFYLGMIQKGADGKYHLPGTYSPEFGPTPDCNYDLSLLRWGCETLVRESERLKMDDPLLPKWREVRANLTDFPADAHGFRIGRDLPLDKSHRHYSHLLMMYPLYVVNWDQPANRERMTASLDWWMSMKNRLAGFSYTGAASMAASMGRGDDAVKYLKEGVDRFVTPNTMYLEADSPVIETPLSGAQSIHDLLLQSWGGTIRIFPAVPESWKDVAFQDLRAEGAFLVSAVRKDGKTQGARIKSLAGEPCRVLLDGQLRDIPLAKGEEVVFGAGEMRMAPVAAEPGKENSYGLRNLK
jgi:hypothetical protein